MTRAAGREGLKILDMKIMRGHSTETLKQWRQAARQNIATVRQDYDERFIRMWEFYLISCEYFFRCHDGKYFNCNWSMVAMKHRLHGVTSAKPKISIGKKFVPKSILENHRARSAKQGSMGVAM